MKPYKDLDLIRQSIGITIRRDKPEDERPTVQVLECEGELTDGNKEITYIVMVISADGEKEDNIFSDTDPYTVYQWFCYYVKKHGPNIYDSELADIVEQLRVFFDCKPLPPDIKQRKFS